MFLVLVEKAVQGLASQSSHVPTTGGETMGNSCGGPRATVNMFPARVNASSVANLEA